MQTRDEAHVPQPHGSTEAKAGERDEQSLKRARRCVGEDNPQPIQLNLLLPNLNEDYASSNLVSIIMPVHNARLWLPEALQSILDQTHRPLEVVCYDDASTDGSWDILEQWRSANLSTDVRIHLIKGEVNGGVSYARNRAIEASHAPYICLLDADDFMMPTRVESQLQYAIASPDAIIGCNVFRTPADSTPFYVNWICSLTADDLYYQRFRECTIVCPTWFMNRNVFTAVGGFVERIEGLDKVPEDLIFLLEHVERGGKLLKVPEELLCYRYTQTSTSQGIRTSTLQQIRVPYLERQVLRHWPTFTIWGAGKDGKRFFNWLSEPIARCVSAFCDIDDKKVNVVKQYFCRRSGRQIPIIHFTQARPPLIICVASKRCEGELEQNIRSMGFVEGRDFFHFS